MALTKASLVDLNANELILDLDADTSIRANTDDTIDIKIAGSTEVKITATGLAPGASDGNALGTTALEWSDLYLADGAVVSLGNDQDVTLTHVADTGLLLNSTRQLQFGDSGTYIHQSADGVLDLVSDTEIEINATTIDINGNVEISGTLSAATSITVGSAVLTEAELETLDGITAGTVIASKALVADASIDITGGRNITITGELDAATGDFSGDVDIDGTANLDVVDIDGATQIDAIVTVGVNDTGYDVKFFGATSGAYMLWDESADDLILAGAGRVVVPDGNLVLGSTAVTSTAAELNLLDTAAANSVVNSKAVIYGSSGELAGTLSTAAQANVTSLGTLTALTVDDVAVDGKVITMTGSSGDTAVMTVATNGALSLVTTDTAAAAANIQITADGTAELAGTTVTLDSSGGITLDADGGTITFADAGSSLGTITSSGYSGTSAIATAVTITDNESTNENNAIIFTAGGDLDGGNLGLESDGDLYYNPSTGTLSVTNIVTTGTHTVTNSVTMNASNAVVFEGATADASETTLTSVDATADRTISLPNVSGTLPVLAAASTTAITATPVELNYVDGVTSAIQTQFNTIIANDWVTQARMAVNSIDSDQYVDGSIDTAHIGDDQVTAAKLAASLKTAGITDIGYDAGDFIAFDNTTIKFYCNSAERMLLEGDGDLHVDGDVIAYSTTVPSDERLKHDIKPIGNALDKVCQLNGVTFTYNTDGKKSAGLIAQDVEKVLPSAVSETELPLKIDDGQKYKVLQYDQTIGLLVEAIKELTAKVEKLEKK